ncbi:hypothetical protein IGJ94_002300 [Enterococcus sp. AZ153]
MRLRQKLKEYLFYRHVFYCPDCRYTLRFNNNLLQQYHPWDGPYCPKCGEKIQKK